MRNFATIEIMNNTPEDPKNEAPAGTPPASGSGSRGAGPEPDAHTCSPQLRAFGGQGTGALQRLVASWELEAANFEARAKVACDNRKEESATLCRTHAAAYRECARLLAAAIGAPRPQSEGKSVPNCSLCDQHHYEGVETECLKKSACPFWAIRKSD